MNYRLMLMLNAIVVAVFGAAFLLVPTSVLVFFGTTDYTASAVMAARFLGGALLTAALLLWFAKDLADEGAQQGVGFGLLASSVGGAVLSVMGMASSSAVIRSKGWLLLILFVVFGLGYAFMLFVVPKMQIPEAKPRRKARSG